MLDTGATGESSSNSGSIIVSPTPSGLYQAHARPLTGAKVPDSHTPLIVMYVPGLPHLGFKRGITFTTGEEDAIQVNELGQLGK